MFLILGIIELFVHEACNFLRSRHIFNIQFVNKLFTYLTGAYLKK